VPKRLAIGATCGLIWGVVAAAVFVAMFRGDLPAPGRAGLPVAIAMVVLYLPFLVAAGLETAVGRGSAPFAEIIGVTLASGAGLGLLVSAVIALARRGAKDRRRPP
jgi:protein-S-isoprenylcysteine O-methyltransferase Ste14